MRFDPLIPSAFEYKQEAKSQLVEQMIQGMRANVAVRGVYIADVTAKPRPPQELGEDGRPMTMERRQQLAEARRLDQLNWEALNSGKVEGNNPLHDAPIETEPLGESAEKALPGMRVIRPQEFRPLSKEEVQAIHDGSYQFKQDIMNTPEGKTKHEL